MNFAERYLQEMREAQGAKAAGKKDAGVIPKPPRRDPWSAPPPVPVEAPTGGPPVAPMGSAAPQVAPTIEEPSVEAPTDFKPPWEAERFGVQDQEIGVPSYEFMKPITRLGGGRPWLYFQSLGKGLMWPGLGVSVPLGKGEWVQLGELIDAGIAAQRVDTGLREPGSFEYRNPEWWIQGGAHMIGEVMTFGQAIKAAGKLVDIGLNSVKLGPSLLRLIKTSKRRALIKGVGGAGLFGAPSVATPYKMSRTEASMFMAGEMLGMGALHGLCGVVQGLAQTGKKGLEKAIMSNEEMINMLIRTYGKKWELVLKNMSHKERRRIADMIKEVASTTYADNYGARIRLLTTLDPDLPKSVKRAIFDVWDNRTKYFTKQEMRDATDDLVKPFYEGKKINWKEVDPQMLAEKGGAVAEEAVQRSSVKAGGKATKQTVKEPVKAKGDYDVGDVPVVKEPLPLPSKGKEGLMSKTGAIEYLRVKHDIPTQKGRPIMDAVAIKRYEVNGRTYYVPTDLDTMVPHLKLKTPGAPVTGKAPKPPVAPSEGIAVGTVIEGVGEIIGRRFPKKSKLAILKIKRADGKVEEIFESTIKKKMKDLTKVTVTKPEPPPKKVPGKKEPKAVSEPIVEKKKGGIKRTILYAKGDFGKVADSKLDEMNLTLHIDGKPRTVTRKYIKGLEGEPHELKETIRSLSKRESDLRAGIDDVSGPDYVQPGGMTSKDVLTLVQDARRYAVGFAEAKGVDLRAPSKPSVEGVVKKEVKAKTKKKPSGKGKVKLIQERQKGLKTLIKNDDPKRVSAMRKEKRFVENALEKETDKDVLAILERYKAYLEKL